MSALVGLVTAYVLGAVPASYIAGRLRGIDLRQHGSRNLGATNVYRVLGWRAAVPVAVFDVGKGALAVALGRWLGGSAWLPLACGIAAVLGHVYSPFLQFRGGKGVATAAGVFLGLAPTALLAALLVWSVTLGLSGYVSLSSIVAAVTFPVLVRLSAPEAAATCAASVALALLIVYTHRGNIRRLLAGTESRFRPRGRVKGPE